MTVITIDEFRSHRALTRFPAVKAKSEECMLLAISKRLFERSMLPPEPAFRFVGRHVTFYGDHGVIVAEDLTNPRRPEVTVAYRPGDKHGPTTHRHAEHMINRNGVTVVHYTYPDDLDTDRVGSAEVARLAKEAENAEASRRRVNEEKMRKRDAEQAEFSRLWDEFRPEWAKAVIVAEYNESECDSMTDYYGHRTTGRVLLAWSRHTRNNFKEMRKAARNFGPTTELADGPKSYEHRENYSMGGGYYLAAEWRHRSGWKVKKERCENGLPVRTAAFGPLLPEEK